MTEAADVTLPPAALDHDARTVEGRTPLPLTFTGSAGEYFRIWIVNLFLSVVTLGIYSAWAKVRTKQYLYRHTWLDGASFEYLADPVKILKGRILAVVALGLTALAQKYSVGLYMLCALLLLAVAPWVMVKALGFNARNSAWRNVRFSFHGTTRQAALEYLKGFGFALVTLGIGSSFILWRLTRFAVRSHSFGKLPFRFRTEGVDFFIAYFFAGGILFGTILVMMPVVFLVGIDESRRSLGLMAGMGVGYFTAFAFLKARLANLTWGGIDIGPHRVSASLTFWRILWIRLTNVLAIVCTLGLAVPWAKIRSHRYVVGQLTLHASGPLVAESEPSTDTGGATGDALGDIGGFDLGFG